MADLFVGFQKQFARSNGVADRFVNRSGDGFVPLLNEWTWDEL